MALRGFLPVSGSIRGIGFNHIGAAESTENASEIGMDAPCGVRYQHRAMKDLVENRRLLSLGEKMEILRVALRQNGPRWSLLLGLYYAASKVADTAFQGMHRLRLEKGIPGMNSAELNRAIWRNWDWQKGGEEWTVSPEWKDSLLRCVLDAEMPRDGHIVEIGPGAGRWTGALIDRSTRYTGVDISDTCVALCREKFAASSARAGFHVTTGAELSMVADEAADAVWSYDVFVHINEPEAAGYAREFRRILKPGARGVIQHGAVAGEKGGWRSTLTTESFARILGESGLRVVRQFDHWEDAGTRHPCGLYGDVITVFERPS
jgi:ubiquinone/menaquinone biosynthesis C-methylase UbiE